MDVVSQEVFLLVVYCSHPLLGCRNHEQAAGTDHGGGTVQSMYLQPSLSTSSGRGPKHCPQHQGLLLGARGTPKMCLGVKMK